MVRKEHGEGGDDQSCRHVSDKISTIRQALDAACTEIDKHHENTSLFLESLFRRDHFEKGRFVLRSKNLNVENEIIGPQLDHYQQRLLARGIAIERSEDLKNENFIIQADFGLLAQVYANFFSNAVKYTNEVIDNNGKPRKAMAYGRKILYNYYGPGKPGVKFNVFTTGHHLPGDEVHHLFDDGFKGSNSSETNSHGHGLAFVKMVIELHGGIVGHELTEQGNNFYFILPIVSVQPNTSA
jgi:signal transduction histidine kinase